MSLVIKFYFTSSILNMFRTLIHPSSRKSLRLFYCITTLVVCSCFDQCGDTIEKSQGPDGGCINV